jgi:hypothetical protein
MPAYIEKNWSALDRRVAARPPAAVILCPVGVK